MDFKTLTPRLPLVLFLLLLTISTAAQSASKLRTPKEAAFVFSRAMTQSKEEIIEIADQALQVIGVDYVDRKEGRLESEYFHHKVGPSRFRTRVTVVVTRRAEGTVASVKAQRWLLLEDLSPTIYQNVPKWQRVGAHEAIQQDIIERIETAAGVWVDPEKEALRRAAADALEAAGGVPGTLAVAGDIWQEVQGLKTERRDLLAPIRALDEEALAIVYGGEIDSRQDELQLIKTERNRLWDQTRPRVMEIDKRILELVLSE